MRRVSFRLLELEPRTTPATFTVTSLADSGTGTLRDALALADAAPGADTIVFKLPAPPAHGENVITLATGLTSTGDVTITGPGAGELIVSGNGTVRVFDFDDGNIAADSPVTVSGLSVVDGNAVGNGGGIASTESLTLKGVVVSGNTADNGGGVAVLGTQGAKTATLSGCLILANTANNYSGGLALPGLQSVTISKSIISGNTATANSGGAGYVSLAASGTAIAITKCQIVGNTGTYGGGLVVVEGSTAATAKATISGCTIVGNTSTNSGTSGGGGLYLTGGNLAVTGCTVSNNSAVYDGGGIEAAAFAYLTITKSTVTGNRTTKTAAGQPGGGGIAIIGDGSGTFAPATVTGCVVNDNTSAGGGGGILAKNGLNLTVTASTVTGNRALGGGGLMTYGSAANQVTVTITGGTFANDAVPGLGGGMKFSGSGPVSLTGTKVTGCAALEGGGIYADCTAAANGFVVKNCTVSGNVASLGGGLMIANTPDFHVTGGSITNNLASASYGGGAFLSVSGGSIVGTTITGNTAKKKGGGVSHGGGGGTVTLEVAKVHGNTAPTNPDVDGTFTFV